MGWLRYIILLELLYVYMVHGINIIAIQPSHIFLKSPNIAHVKTQVFQKPPGMPPEIPRASKENPGVQTESPQSKYKHAKG